VCLRRGKFPPWNPNWPTCVKPGKEARPAEAYRPTLLLMVHAVEHDRVEVQVEIQGVAEALDERIGDFSAVSKTSDKRIYVARPVLTPLRGAF
jgi:hypothetical protein